MSSTHITIYLGMDPKGRDRKRALEGIAADAGHEWGGEASIGRWLVSVADERISEMWAATVTINEDGSGKIDWNGSGADFRYMGADAENKLGKGPNTVRLDAEDAERFYVAGNGVLQYD